MDKESKIVIGEKEYTRDELLIFGQQHYPKFYWIYRGIGLGLMSIGVTIELIFFILAIATKEIYNDSSYFNWVFYSEVISFATLIIAGIILVTVSFKKLPDEAYIKHATDYFTKLDLREKQRAEKASKRQEQQEINKILKYKKLLDAGVISQEEYEEKKKELL